jgi:predicted flap endonuclease-1-like 5' DNA nuclease/predicted  nucleic acid-binding Zn-ribbon protein
MDNPFPFILSAVVGLIAAIIGWLLGSGAQRRRAAEALEAALNEQKSGFDQLQKQHDQKTQLLTAMQGRYSDLEKKQSGFDAELAQWKQQVLEAQNQMENARCAQTLTISEFQAYKSVTNTQLSELSKQNNGLEAHLQGLRTDMHQRDARMAALAQENEAMQGSTSALQQRYDQYVAASTAQYSDLKATFETQSAQLDAARLRVAELERLRDQLQETNEEWEASYQQNTHRIGDLERLRDQLQEANAEWEATFQEHTNRISDLERLRDQLQETNEEWEGSYQQNTHRIGDLERLRDQLQETNAEWEATFQEHTNRIAELERLRDQLQETNEEWEAVYQQNTQQIGIQETEIKRLQSALDDLNARYDVEIESALSDLETYKQRIEHLLAVQQSNNALIGNLETEISRLRAGGASATPTAAPATAAATIANEEEVLNRIRKRAKLLDFKRIGKANSKNPDDLERIKGIGPFTARKLNALGIQNYRQLAALTDEDIIIVNDAIEFMQGRILRDDWRGQAAAMTGV